MHYRTQVVFHAIIASARCDFEVGAIFLQDVVYVDKYIIVSLLAALLVIEPQRMADFMHHNAKLSKCNCKQSNLAASYNGVSIISNLRTS